MSWCAVPNAQALAGGYAASSPSLLRGAGEADLRGDAARGLAFVRRDGGIPISLQAARTSLPSPSQRRSPCVAAALTVEAPVSQDVGQGVLEEKADAATATATATVVPAILSCELADRPLWLEKNAKKSSRGGIRRRRSRSLNSSSSSISSSSSGGEGLFSAANKLEADAETPSGPVLGWLKDQQPPELQSERTIWRVNRSIARCTSVREALQVVEEMKSAGLNSANEGTYVALITVCRRQRQGERALVVYEAMKQAGVRPGLLTFNTIIGCCQQAQRVEDAFRLKVDMEALGLKPDAVTYTTLMALVVKAGPYRGRSSPTQRLQKALDLFMEMQQRGVPADVITFNTLLQAAAQAKLPGKVLEVYGMMASAGVAPNQVTFGILLEAIGQGGRLKQALEVFNEMKAAGVPPQSSTYTYLLEACARSPQPDAKKAWDLFEEMTVVRGLKYNSETLSYLVDASVKGADHEGAMRAYELMKTSGFTKAITVATFNKLIHSADMSGSMDKAFELYAAMREAGYTPDVITFGTLVSACSRERNVERAIGVMEEMAALGVRPNQATYHALMGAYGRTGQWEEAIKTLREMQRTCPEEPALLPSYSIAFDACFGREGADAAVVEAAATEKGFQVTPGIQAAMDLYREGMESGLFRNFSEADLSRCDVRTLTRSSMIVCLLVWLERLRAHPVPADLVLVTGSDKGRAVATGDAPRGRLPKLFVCALRTFQALGLSGKSLRTLTMQAVTIERQQVQAWLQQPMGGRQVAQSQQDKKQGSTAQEPSLAEIVGSATS